METELVMAGLVPAIHVLAEARKTWMPGPKGAGGRADAHKQMEGEMIAVIFEVWPAEGRKDDYVRLAAALRSELDQADGFISIERFQSLTEPAKLLSLSFWRDEEAVRAWRNNPRHRTTQAAGRAGIFADYRLRIGAVIRNYGMTDRAEAPADSRATHEGQAAL